MEKIITKRANGTIRVQHKTCGTCKVQQHSKEQCDIEAMVAKYKRTGQMKIMQNPMYGDFSKISSYHDAQNQILAAEAAFMQIPSKIRQMFDNNPQKIIDFVNDKKNDVKCVELGLLDKSVLKNSIPKQQKDDKPSETPKKAEAKASD